MGLFDNFPYTNFHELNLDWILKILKEIQTTIEQFVAINSLKYADPIQWDITTQYEKNTIVIEPVSGTAYISVRAVPSGVDISNTDYWTPVFDLSYFIIRAGQNFANTFEATTTATATMATPEGGWIVWDSLLYQAMNNISVGDAYVVGGNIELRTVEYFFDLLKGLIAAEAITRHDEDLRIELDLTDLITSKVGIEAGLRASEDARIELDLTNLITSKVGIEAGLRASEDARIELELSNLITSQVNILNTNIDSVYYNIVKHGADPTGTEDCIDIIEDGLASGLSVYIPRGRFKISRTIHLKTGNSLIGANPNDMALSDKGSILILDNDTDHVVEIDSGARFVTVQNILLDRNVTGTVTGDGLHVNQTTHIKIYNVTSQNNRYGFYLSSTGWSYIDKCVAQLNFSHGFMYQNTAISGALQWQTTGCLADRNDGSGFVIYGVDNTYHVVSLGVFDKCATFANGAYGFSIYGSDVGVNGFRILNGFFGNDRHGEIRVLPLGSVGGIIENCYLEIAGAAGAGRNADMAADPVAYGIYVFANSKDVTINGCHIVSCQGDGVGNANDTTTVSNCVIHNNGRSGSGVGIRQSSGTMVITGNTLHDNPSADIAFATDTKSIVVANKLETAPVYAGGNTNIVSTNNVVG